MDGHAQRGWVSAYHLIMEVDVSAGCRLERINKYIHVIPYSPDIWVLHTVRINKYIHLIPYSPDIWVLHTVGKYIAVHANGPSVCNTHILENCRYIWIFLDFDGNPRLDFRKYD